PGDGGASRFQRRYSAASALFLIVGTGTATDQSLNWRIHGCSRRSTGVAALRQVLGQGGRRSRISDRELPGPHRQGRERQVGGQRMMRLSWTDGLGGGQIVPQVREVTR